MVDWWYCDSQSVSTDCIGTDGGDGGGRFGYGGYGDVRGDGLT